MQNNPRRHTAAHSGAHRLLRNPPRRSSNPALPRVGRSAVLGVLSDARPQVFVGVCSRLAFWLALGLRMCSSSSCVFAPCSAGDCVCASGAASAGRCLVKKRESTAPIGNRLVVFVRVGCRIGRQRPGCKKKRDIVPHQVGRGCTLAPNLMSRYQPSSLRLSFSGPCSRFSAACLPNHVPTVCLGSLPRHPSGTGRGAMAEVLGRAQSDSSITVSPPVSHPTQCPPVAVWLNRPVIPVGCAEKSVLSMVTPRYPKISLPPRKDTDLPELVELKLWEGSGARPVQWEVRRLFAAIVPRRPLALGKLMSRELARPRALLVDLLGEDDGVRPPDLQSAKAGTDIMEDARDQWSAYTESLLMLAMWLAYRPGATTAREDRAAIYLAAFLRRFLELEDMVSCSNMPPPAAVDDLCAYGRGDDGCCEHVRGILGRLDRQSIAPAAVDRCLQVVKELVQVSDTCKMVLVWLGQIIVALAQHIDHTVTTGEWPSDPLQSEAVRTGKRRLGVIDSDFRREAIARSYKKGLGSTGAFLSVRDDPRQGGANNWVEQELREVVAQGWLTWNSGGICALQCDGFRCGTEENLAFHLWHSTSGTGGWLPPQAIRLHGFVLAVVSRTCLCRTFPSSQLCLSKNAHKFMAS